MYGDKENPLFLAKDVANWIEHTHTTNMLKAVDEDEKLNVTIIHAGQNKNIDEDEKIKEITPIYNVYNGQYEK